MCLTAHFHPKRKTLNLIIIFIYFSFNKHLSQRCQLASSKQTIIAAKIPSHFFSNKLVGPDWLQIWNIPPVAEKTTSFVRAHLAWKTLMMISPTSNNRSVHVCGWLPFAFISINPIRRNVVCFPTSIQNHIQWKKKSANWCWIPKRKQTKNPLLLHQAPGDFFKDTRLRSKNASGKQFGPVLSLVILLPQSEG